MTKFAVVKSGGKQYIVKEDDKLVVDLIPCKEKDNIELETLAVFDSEGEIAMGTPTLTKKTKATVIANLQGEKIRVARFKAKSRYRKVKGFRPQLTKMQIGKIQI